MDKLKADPTPSKRRVAWDTADGKRVAQSLVFDAMAADEDQSLYTALRDALNIDMVTLDSAHDILSRQVQLEWMDFVNTNNDQLPDGHWLKGHTICLVSDLHPSEPILNRELEVEDHAGRVWSQAVEDHEWFDNLMVVRLATDPLLSEYNSYEPETNPANHFVSIARDYIAVKYGSYTIAQLDALRTTDAYYEKDGGEYEIMIGDFEKELPARPLNQQWSDSLRTGDHFGLGFESPICQAYHYGDLSWAKYYKIRSYSPYSWTGLKAANMYAESQRGSYMFQADFGRNVFRPYDDNKRDYFPRMPDQPYIPFYRYEYVFKHGDASRTISAMDHATLAAKAVHWILMNFLPGLNESLLGQSPSADRFSFDLNGETFVSDYFSNTTNNIADLPTLPSGSTLRPSPDEQAKGYMIPYDNTSDPANPKQSLLYKYCYMSAVGNALDAPTAGLDPRIQHMCPHQQYCTLGSYYEKVIDPAGNAYQVPFSTFEPQSYQPYDSLWEEYWAWRAPPFTYSHTFWTVVSMLPALNPANYMVSQALFLGWVASNIFEGRELTAYETLYWQAVYTAIYEICLELHINPAELAQNTWEGPIDDANLPSTDPFDLNGWNNIPQFKWSQQPFLISKADVAKLPPATEVGDASDPLNYEVTLPSGLGPWHLDFDGLDKSDLTAYIAWMKTHLGHYQLMPHYKTFCEYDNPNYTGSSGGGEAATGSASGGGEVATPPTIAEWMTTHAVTMLDIGGVPTTVPMIWNDLFISPNSIWATNRPTSYNAASDLATKTAALAEIMAALPAGHSQEGVVFEVAADGSSVSVPVVYNLEWNPVEHTDTTPASFSEWHTWANQSITLLNPTTGSTETVFCRPCYKDEVAELYTSTSSPIDRWSFVYTGVPSDNYHHAEVQLGVGGAVWDALAINVPWGDYGGNEFMLASASVLHHTPARTYAAMDTAYPAANLGGSQHQYYKMYYRMEPSYVQQSPSY